MKPIQESWSDMGFIEMHVDMIISSQTLFPSVLVATDIYVDKITVIKNFSEPL